MKNLQSLEGFIKSRKESFVMRRRLLSNPLNQKDIVNNIPMVQFLEQELQAIDVHSDFQSLPLHISAFVDVEKDSEGNYQLCSEPQEDSKILFKGYEVYYNGNSTISVEIKESHPEVIFRDFTFRKSTGYSTEALLISDLTSREFKVLHSAQKFELTEKGLLVSGHKINTIL